MTEHETIHCRKSRADRRYHHPTIPSKRGYHRRCLSGRPHAEKQDEDLFQGIAR